ncbi:MAG: hypothetical protein Q9228_002353 [Teloschistes exilis]
MIVPTVKLLFSVSDMSGMYGDTPNDIWPLTANFSVSLRDGPPHCDTPAHHAHAPDTTWNLGLLEADQQLRAD